MVSNSPEFVVAGHRTWLAIAFLILGVAAMPAYGDDGVSDFPTINNIFYESDLRQALMDIGAEVGVSIVAAADVAGFVTCELVDVPLDRALDMMLAGTGYVATWTDNYILVGSADPRSQFFWQVAKPRRITLSYLEAEIARKMLPESLRIYVEPDPAGHCLSVFAPDAIASAVEGVLTAIDLPPRQVMLEARIVLLQKSGSDRLGATWDWPGLSAGAFIGDASSSVAWVARAGLTPAGELTDALMVSLDLMDLNDEATTVANPRVLAYEGREAKIAVLTEEYFKILTEDYYQRSTLEKVETGIMLKLNPRIGDSGDIIMDIETEVSDVIARGEEDLPVVTRRTTKSRARVPDRGTVVISGLTDHRERRSKRKIPVLGSLPLVGRLFSLSATEHRDNQVAVFITPRIVEAARPDSAAGVSPPRFVLPAGPTFDHRLRESLGRMRNGVDR